MSQSNPYQASSTDNRRLPAALSRQAQYMILAAAFLGWMFAGGQMAINALASRSATSDMLFPTEARAKLSIEQDKIVGQWYARHQAAFLLGAALGGLVFGWLGDRSGRTKAMGMSILTFTGFCGAGYFANTPEQWMVLRFLAGLGIGGMWPNGIALVQEAWSDVSRPILAGLIGTAANVGLMIVPFLSLSDATAVTPNTWRMAMLATASPLPLGLLVLIWLPESPRWLAQRDLPRTTAASSPLAEVFWPPFLFVTVVGILLATVPLFGGWGNGNWLVSWADSVGTMKDPHLKAWTQFFRAFGGTIGSLIGGGVAAWLGRRRSYFLISVTSLVIAQYIYRDLDPKHIWFGTWTFIQGIVGGLYFGWLPLCLPEMFPTRVRSTGAGVTFNFGRILTAAGVVGMASLLGWFDNDYAKVGSTTSLVYIVGMLVIWLAPVSGELKDDK